MRELSRCMNCFNWGRSSNTVVCGKCLDELFPGKLQEFVRPYIKKEAKGQNVPTDEDRAQVLVLLESSAIGLRLRDFPERLRPTVRWLFLTGKISKPQGESRYQLKQKKESA